MLVDTDVLLDVVLGREPFAGSSGELLDALERRPGTGCIAWHSASNLYSLITASEPGEGHARDFLRELTGFLEVAPTTTASLRQATELPMADFEDAMQVAAALAFRAEVIVTRSLRVFRASPVPALEPGEALERLRGV